MAKQIIEIQKKIAPILKEYNITKAGIFGSYARGDFKKKSDVDILIELDDKYDILELYNNGVGTEEENPLNHESYFISAAEWAAGIEVPFTDTPINDINREAHFVITELGEDYLGQDSSYYIVGIGKDLNGDYSSDSTLIPGVSMDGDSNIADSAIARFTVEGTR